MGRYILTQEGADMVGASVGDSITLREDEASEYVQEFFGDYEKIFSVDNELVGCEYDPNNPQHHVGLTPDMYEKV